jgi:hypothetical protein
LETQQGDEMESQQVRKDDSESQKTTWQVWFQFGVIGSLSRTTCNMLKYVQELKSFGYIDEEWKIFWLSTFSYFKNQFKAFRNLWFKSPHANMDQPKWIHLNNLSLYFFMFMGEDWETINMLS